MLNPPPHQLHPPPHLITPQYPLRQHQSSPNQHQHQSAIAIWVVGWRMLPKTPRNGVLRRKKHPQKSVCTIGLAEPSNVSWPWFGTKSIFLTRPRTRLTLKRDRMLCPISFQLPNVFQLLSKKLPALKQRPIGCSSAS